MRIAATLSLSALFAITLGCRPDLPQCETDGQCPVAQVCVEGACVNTGLGVGPDGGDRDPNDAGPLEGDGDGGPALDAGVDAGDAGPLDDGRDPDAGPGEPFDSGPSDPPVNNGRDGG